MHLSLVAAHLWGPCSNAQETAGGPKLIRVTATPAGMKPKASRSVAPQITPGPNGGLPEKDDFMLKFNHLFGANGKLVPTKTPIPVSDDAKTSAQRVAEMARELRAKMTPGSSGPNWVRDATPAPQGYVAPTYKPSARRATPAPGSKLPAIDLGGSGTSSYP